MGDAAQDAQSKRVAELRSSRRWDKYLKLGTKGLELDARAIKAAEHCGGKFVVHGNDDTLSAEDMAPGYKQLMRVEQAWRDVKSTLDMRPVFHSVTEPTPDAAKCLKSLQIKPPPPVLRLA
jgi:hypothetical protein